MDLLAGRQEQKDQPLRHRNKYLISSQSLDVTSVSQNGANVLKLAKLFVHLTKIFGLEWLFLLNRTFLIVLIISLNKW